MQNTSGGIQHILLTLILLERVNTMKKPRMNNFDCIGFHFIYLEKPEDMRLDTVFSYPKCVCPF